jgi:hypothetical protein
VWRRRKAFAGGIAEYASMRLFVCVGMVRMCVEGGARENVPSGRGIG